MTLQKNPSKDDILLHLREAARTKTSFEYTKTRNGVNIKDSLNPDIINNIIKAYDELEFSEQQKILQEYQQKDNDVEVLCALVVINQVGKAAIGAFKLISLVILTTIRELADDGIKLLNK